MIAQQWQSRTAGPLTFHYREGSHGHDSLDAIVERYSKVVGDACAFLEVSPASLKPISIYLSDMLEPGSNGQQAAGDTRIDPEKLTLWTVVTSESAGSTPESELMQLVLRSAHGPGVPEARFWEDGLAGYLAAKGGSAYFAEAAERAQKMREEGQLRSLVNVVRQHAERRSSATTTMAVAFVTYLIDWRGAERFRRFLLSARSGTADAFNRAYRSPLTKVDQTWVRRMEATSQAAGGKSAAAIKGILPHLRPYSWHVVGILVTTLLGLSFDVFMPLAIRFIVDNILGGRPVPFPIPLVTLNERGAIPEVERVDALIALAAVMVFMFLLNAFARIRQTAMTATVSQGVNFNMRCRFLEHIQRLPISFHSRTPATEITQRFFTDLAYVPAAFSAGIVPIVSSGLAIIIFTATMLSVNPWLSLVALLGLPAFFIAAQRGRQTVRDNQRETARRAQEIQQSIVENMNAQTLLKTWNARPSVLERFRERLDINRELNVRNMIITSALARTTVLITNFAQVTLLLIGGLIVIWSAGADLTAGGLFAFYALLLRLYAPAGVFAGAFQTLSLSADGLERVNRILERKVEEEPADAVDVGPLKEAIRFEGVGFAQVKGKNLLKDVNLTIPAGSTVAFVGPTGAGKATLMQLLPRLHDVTEGRITWDGVDLKKAKRESVRAQIISLPQETFVLNLTIYENILLGRPTAPEQEVISAARTVGLHEFVQGLPGGYDTVVSDRDTALSTPHRQRLAAARALLRTEASVLLIEDGLSAIEAAEQQQIERALRGPDGARTVIKITSRIGTITDADEIFVMDGGEVVERGKHDELLDRNGLYVQLTKDELGEAAVSGARQAVRRLSKLAPFSSLPPEVLEETAHLLLYAERDPGEVICRQGSHGDELYIIGRGDVEIVVADDEGHEQIVNVLGENDYVGEISFLRRVPRTTTVRAQSKVELHILRRVDFDALLERLGAGTLDHMEETAQSRIEDTRQKLAALSGGTAG